PGMDGFEGLDQLRSQGSRMPVIILTARDSVTDTVTALDSGADDYMAKPFQIEEVLARLRALIRRAAGHASPELAAGALRLDPRRARVSVDGRPVALTGHEFRVLSYLMHHRGRVVSQTELTEHIYAHGADRDSNTVEVFVARLRRKLGGPYITTVRGFGYRLDGDANDA
ncbi:MAG: winged helix-turn-helix domain-containing protein, partial [Vicinamibacteria bacterium]